MSTIAEIRHHIHVVEDTRKITRAMFLISSAKMTKAMRMHDQNASYFQRVRSDIRFMMENTDGGLNNPYCRQHPGKQVAFLVIAGDKGLCGGYNSEVLKLALRVIEAGDYKQRSLFTIGHEAADFFYRRNMNPDINYLHIIQDPSLFHARRLTSELCRLFRQKYLDEIYVVYTVMEGIGKLKPTVLRLLPVIPEDFHDAQILHAPTASLAYHPSASEVLEAMVPHYLVGLVYSALVQSYA
ncbi:MAG: FoF1 ATP synthase subunit gamma, partial [Clostridia bacterium]